MSIVRYITHPNVDIDPTMAVPEWSLSAVGRRRALALLDQPWIVSIGRILSSPETKAIETADVIAERLDLFVQVRRSSGETDRSATGYVEAERHERLAHRFFADPERSADGWERAVDAQRRIVDAFKDILHEPTDDGGDVAIVGHGAVGTLLMCHLDGREISRAHDQPSQGHYWSYDRSERQLLHAWRPIDDASDPGPR